MLVTKICRPASCVTAYPRASLPFSVRYPAIFWDATTPIAIGNVRPANPGAKSKEKKSGSFTTMNRSDARTQKYRKYSSILFGLSYTLTRLTTQRLHGASTTGIV